MTIIPFLTRRPQTKRELAERMGITAREVEQLVNAARHDGKAIMSSGDGCWRSDASGLIAALHVTDGLQLMFASGDNDADTVGNIDHLIDGLQALRRLVVAIQADPAIVAAVSEQVPA